MITGLVKAVRKDGKGFMLEDETWYGARSAGDIGRVNKGDSVEFNSTQSPCGRYNNIQGPVSVSGGSAPAAANNSAPVRAKGFPLAHDVSTRAINRQNALTNSVAFHAHDDANTEEKIILTAKKFEAYTTGDLDKYEPKMGEE